MGIEAYKRQVRRTLARLEPVFARAAVGDYSRNLKVPEKEDEFLDLFVGIQIMIEVIRDQLAELRRTNEDLQRLNRARAEFTSIVSHEIRTPLNAIKEGIGIVLDGIDGPVTKDQGESLGIAKSNVDRLTRLINNVLDFTRLDMGKMEISFQKTDMNSLAVEVFRLMRPTVEKKRVHFSLRVPKRPVRADCDPDRIRGVIINLVDNALKFTEPDGKIGIALSASGQKVRVDVTDTGPGIPKSERRRIFDLFHQGGAGPVGGSKGAGIGLAVCKLVLDRHRGEITVRGGPRGGTRFTISWPGRLKKYTRSPSKLPLAREARPI